MKLSSKLLTAIVAILLALALVFFTAGFFFKNFHTSTDKEIVTSQTILERITDQYFVVTKTAYIDQETSIVVDRGSTWSNFWWGETLKADAVVRVDIGVDLTGLSQEDIRVDSGAGIVSITLPEATVLDASLFGDIEVTTHKGVLSRLVENDPNADHNLAAKRLITSAREGVEQDERLFNEAQENSVKLLRLIVGDFGYNLEIDRAE